MSILSSFHYTNPKEMEEMVVYVKGLTHFPGICSGVINLNIYKSGVTFFNSAEHFSETKHQT